MQSYALFLKTIAKNTRNNREEQDTSISGFLKILGKFLYYGAKIYLNEEVLLWKKNEITSYCFTTKAVCLNSDGY